MALRDAMKARDKVAVGALRSVLGVIANAEAVPGESMELDGDAFIAGAVSGVGATEAARRELTDDDVVGLVRAEADDRRSAAEEYRGYGQLEHAERLDAEAEVLESHLS
jgi:uncharacterized protein YqeY